MLRLLTAAVIAGSVMLPLPVIAATIEGIVTRVKDGDSIVVRRGTFGGRETEVRLAAIDAPEYRQPWGQRSRQALARLVADRRVTVRGVDRDRYGRVVGYVRAGDVNVNLAMAASGNAWAYSRYERDPAILAAASRARAQRIGLWSLPERQRIPPPAWREANPRRD